MRTLIKSAFLKLFVFDEAVSNLARLIFCNMLKNKLQSHNFHKLRQCYVIKCKHPKQVSIRNKGSVSLSVSEASSLKPVDLR